MVCYAVTIAKSDLLTVNSLVLTAPTDFRSIVTVLGILFTSKHHFVQYIAIEVSWHSYLISGQIFKQLILITLPLDSCLTTVHITFFVAV